jgi:hypothetical protein
MDDALVKRSDHRLDTWRTWQPCINVLQAQRWPCLDWAELGDQCKHFYALHIELHHLPHQRTHATHTCHRCSSQPPH